MALTEEVSAERLEAHVATLAGEFGERNVFRPRALHGAADYIAAQWREQGYEVAPYPYRSETWTARIWKSPAGAGRTAFC